MGPIHTSLGFSPNLSNMADTDTSAVRDWYYETEVLWPGQKLGLEVTKRVMETQTEFQHLEVVETRSHGTMLALDGVIQLTERDEVAYHEMMVHVPLRLHGAPETVLVVGGGDGGAVREVLRHPSVSSVVLCELDPEVTAAARTHLPQTAGALDDARVTIVHQEAAAWLASSGRTFDAIIVDSSDPVGPAETLVSPEFYASVHAALAPHGIMVAQAESLWLHAALIAGILSTCSSLFSSVGYYWTSVPTYPSGQIGWVVCSNDIDVNAPPASPTPSFVSSLSIYSPQTHAASFVLAPMHARAIGLTPSTPESLNG